MPFHWIGNNNIIKFITELTFRFNNTICETNEIHDINFKLYYF